MTEERTRRRRRRDGRGGGQRSEVQEQVEVKARPEARPRATEADGWLWFTFPVFASFVAGAFFILLIGPTPATDPFRVLFFLFLGLSLFCLIHITVRWQLRRRRRRAELES